MRERIRKPSEMPTPRPPEPATWEEARLTPSQASALIGLGEGLVAIGRMRTGVSSGQISLHNFLLRAAAEDEDDDSSALVVLMRAGVFRRHTFFLRYYADTGGEARLELPGAIDRGWTWLRPFEEARDRLVGNPAWNEAVGAPFAERARKIGIALTRAKLVRGVTSDHTPRD